MDYFEYANINARLLSRERAIEIAREFGVSTLVAERELAIANDLVQMSSERDCMGNIITGERFFLEGMNRYVNERMLRQDPDYPLRRAEEKHLAGRYSQSADFDF